MNNHVPRSSKDEALVTALVTLSKAVETLAADVGAIRKRVTELEQNTMPRRVIDSDDPRLRP